MNPLRLLLTAGLLIIGAGCGGNETEPTKPNSPTNAPTVFESPQAVFVAFQKAVEKKDWKQAATCMTSDAQSAVAMLLTIPASMMAAFDESKQPEVEQLFAKYGLRVDEGPPGVETADHVEAVREFGRQIKDKPAFIAEIIDWMNKQADEGEEESVFSSLATKKLSNVQIGGDSATAVLTPSVDGENSSQPMEFKKENGSWLLHVSPDELQPNEPQGDDSTPKEAGAPEDFGVFVENGGQKAAVKTLSLQEFNAMWQTSLDVQNQPAQPLLQQFAEELDLTVQASGAVNARLQQPVTVNLKKRSRLEIIEEICRQVDVHSVFSDQSITFQPEARRIPVSFAGPFLVEVADVTQDAEYATGVLKLRVFAANLPESIIKQLNEHRGAEAIQVTRIADANGKSLIRVKRSGGTMAFVQQRNVDRTVTLQLKHLLRDLETLAAVEGMIQIPIPTEVAVLRFDELNTGATKSSGDVELKLQSANPQSISVGFQGTTLEQIQLLAFDASGNRLESFGTGGFGAGDGGMTSLSVQGQAKSLEARVVTKREQLSWQFSFENVPLPDFAQAPVKLAETQFKGKTPILLEFSRIGGEPNFRTVIFNVTNHANKDAESISIDVRFLDAGGKELKKSSKTFNSQRMTKNGRTEIEVMAFFMPEKTKSATATVNHVVFADDTTWSVRGNQLIDRP